MPYELSIKIVCKGPAFGETADDGWRECARILMQAAAALLDGEMHQTLRDINRNAVGDLRFEAAR